MYMPAEYGEHECSWMLWPERKGTWRKNGGPAQAAFAAVARAIAQFEPVRVGVKPAAGKVEEARRIIDCEAVQVLEVEQNDSWVRDTGPTFVINVIADEGCEESPLQQASLAGVHWGFNAYGGLYEPFDNDRQIARIICEYAGVQRVACDMILEGGSICSDGEGTLLVTEECLLNPNRNPELHRGLIEENLCKFLGVEKVLWLPFGVYKDDDTNGHVDNMCAFARPGEVVLHWTDDTQDPQHERSAADLAYLDSVTDARNRPLKVHKLPMPQPMYYTAEEAEEGTQREAGERLAASYVNAYIVNGGVIVPGFGQSEQDAEAVRIYESVFPDREVVQVPTREPACYLTVPDGGTLSGGVLPATAGIKRLATNYRTRMGKQHATGEDAGSTSDRVHRTKNQRMLASASRAPAAPSTVLRNSVDSQLERMDPSVTGRA